MPLFCPPSTDQAQELLQKRPAPRNGVWVDNPSFANVRQAVGRSFAGSSTIQGEPMCDWALQHTDVPLQERIDCLSFGLGISIRSYMMIDKALVVTKQMNNDSQVLGSTAVVVDYDPSIQQQVGPWTRKWRETKAIVAMMSQGAKMSVLFDGNKKYKPQGDRALANFQLLESTMRSTHKEFGPKERHWYVANVAVDPSCNGQGMGRELMETVHSMADELEIPACYLESGERNIGFYQKMGYQIVHEGVLVDAQDEIQREKFACMVRYLPQK